MYKMKTERHLEPVQGRPGSCMLSRARKVTLHRVWRDRAWDAKQVLISSGTILVWRCIGMLLFNFAIYARFGYGTSARLSRDDKWL